MSDLALPLPSRRPDLILRPFGDDGQWVVKDPATGDFFQLGPAESFLFEMLDGKQNAGSVCAAFAERFGSPLAADELQEFVATAEAQGFLQTGPNRRGADAHRQGLLN